MYTRWAFLLAFSIFFCSSCLSQDINDYYERAYELSCKGKYSEAITLLEGKIAIQDRKFDYYHRIGFYTLLADTKKNRREALSEFMHANELIDDDQRNLYMIGYCYKLINDNDNAMLYLNRSAHYYHATKDEINPFPEIAEIYYHNKMYEETLAAIDLALTYEPDIYYLLLLKSFVYGNLGDNTKSEAFYQDALKKSQDELYPLYRAHYFIEIEKYQDASVLLKQAVEKEILKNECFAEMGYIALINGEDEQAKKLLTDAGKMDLSDELVLQYLTYYYYKHKDKKKTEIFFGLYMMIADDLENITIKDIYHDVESRFADDQTFINLLKSRQ